jgi:2-furoate---CoA ligase
MFDVGQGFLASVARNPGALAIVEDARRLNYGEWADEIRRVAAGLGALGLNKGDHLVTVLQNRLDAATLHWACQITGIIITPLNWRATAAELDSVLADAGARAVAFEAATAPTVAGANSARGIPRLAIGDAAGDRHVDDFRRLDPLTALPEIAPDDPSLMLYTSGTTGRAKGVPRGHSAERAAALAHVAQNLYRFGECTLGVMPLYHTMGVRLLLAMAAINGCFVCLPRFDAGTALTLIAREQISATVRAIGPSTVITLQPSGRDSDATTPGVGRNPTTPLTEAGPRMLPPVSEPVASGVIRAASATPAPPDEPAQLRSRS